MSSAATTPGPTVPSASAAPPAPPWSAYKSVVAQRNALGFALSEALGSLDDAEMYLSDEVADGLIDNVDEAQTFVQDALFEALHAFGAPSPGGDELVWLAGDGTVVYQAPQRDVAEVIAMREANTIEV